MTQNEARIAILNRIATLGLPTDFGGLNMTEDVSTVSPSDTLWIRPVIKFTSGNQASLGGENVATKRNRGGVVMIQLFTAIGIGVGDGDEAANNLVLLFEARSDNGMRYDNVALRDGERDEQWWMQVVSIDFTYSVVCV